MRYIFTFILFCIMSSVFSQEINISGTVTDSLQNPLAWANVVAIPTDKSQQMRFAVTDDKGRYRLNLIKNVDYEIAVTYLGFEKHSFKLEAGTNNSVQHIRLKPADNLLGEVIIMDYPVRKNKDTLSYNVEAFRTGEERKLKELVEKLPGVDLDKDGQVTVQGKKVTRLSVDGKPFFGGGTKLAIDNIPANAVGGIDFVDKYQSVGFMRDFDESEELAMNVKLKKDKKEFAFGNVEAGSNGGNRYVGHSDLFYYSPRTNLTFIGDMNNAGKQFFTYQNAMSFEGGTGSLMQDGVFGGNTNRSEIYTLAMNQNFKDRTNKFGAFNISTSAGKRARINAYVLGFGSDINTASHTEKQYLLKEMSYSEKFGANRQSLQQLALGKVEIDFKPSDNESYLFQSKFKFSDNNNQSNEETETPGNVSRFIQNSDNQSVVANGQLEWHKKISRNRVIAAGLIYNFDKTLPTAGWVSQKPLLAGLLPLMPDTLYTINQQRASSTHHINFLAKHFWNVSNLSQINTSVGYYLVSDKYTSSENQLMGDGTQIGFEDHGFGNDMDMVFHNFFVSMHYKFKKKKLISNQGFYTHYYQWETVQDTVVSKNRWRVFPDFELNYDISSSKKLTIKYQVKSQFPRTQNFVSNFGLQNYYRARKGNPGLENEMFHQASVTYSDFNMFHKLMMSARLDYTHKISGLVYQTRVENQKHYSFPVLMDNPENSFGLFSSIDKGIQRIWLRLGVNIRHSDYIQEINGEISNFRSLLQVYSLGVRTNYKKWPNITASCEFWKNTVKSSGQNSNMLSIKPNFSFKYDFLKGFLFKANYTIDLSKNESTGQKDRFDLASASLFYKNKKSPWGFEVSAANLFNVEARYSYSVSEYMLSTNKTFIFPRIFMFTLSYAI
jgi:hypothetical protein